VLARPGGKHVGNVASGVCAARVHDACAGVAAFPAEAVVESDAEAAQLRDARWSFLRQQPDRAWPAEPASRSERVGCVERRLVARAHSRGHASLSRVAVRAAVRSLRKHEYRRARVGRGQGGRQSCDTGADDGYVGCVAFLPHKR
jgi:hypothetical protein